MKRLVRMLAWSIATLILVQSGGAGALMAERDALVVHAGETLVVDAPIAYETIDVHGRLLAAEGHDLQITAARVTVHAGGLVAGAPGAHAEPTVAPAAQAAPGLEGGSIHIVADMLEVAPNAWVLAGRGGDGGLAVGTLAATGGDGANGGDVVLDVEELVEFRNVWPGAGGDGGRAVVLDGSDEGAEGGDGADAGALLWNGEPLARDLTIPWDVVSPFAPIADAPELRVAELVARLLEGALPEGVTVLDLDPKAIEIGTPGLPGTPDVDTKCSPEGTPGEPNPVGAGGAGGSACSSCSGSGGKGGNFGTFKGGRGGDGSPCESVAARGGDGGAGLTAGGAGGSATTSATGGSGGSGGGSVFVGGDGGNGGDATSGAATGGRGGDAICGPGGAGGKAQTSATGGAGGAGGYGGFANGAPGAAGIGKSGAAVNGLSGGSSVPVCDLLKQVAPAGNAFA